MDTLARSSISFLASASSLARAAMEAGARSMWLLAPDEPFEREVRWLAHLENEVNVRKRLEGALGQDDTGSSTVRAFSAAVRDKLSPGTLVPTQVPKFDALLKAVGAAEKYSVYTYLSQSAHATHHGAGIFRQHLGATKTFGDFASAEDWWLPLSTLWWFLAMPLASFSERCAIAGQGLLPARIQERFVTAQQAYKRGSVEIRVGDLR